MLCGGHCDQVAFKVQGNKFTTNFYTLTLGGCDVIFGVYWLKTLGPILWDFLQLTIVFKLEIRKLELQGLRPTNWTMEEAYGFHNSSNTEKRVVLQVIHQEEESKQFANVTSPQITHLLK